VTPEDDWPPREARVRAALWEAERRLRDREWAQADRALADVVALATEPEAVRGMRCLAAAGYKAREGETERARAHLARARDRLGPFLPAYEDVDLAGLLEQVGEAVEERRP
jgi:hypothetical protein